MIAVLILNFALIAYIGFIMLPLYALAATAVSAEPKALMAEIKAAKAVSHEPHELGVVGCGAARCFFCVFLFCFCSFGKGGCRRGLVGVWGEVWEGF